MSLVRSALLATLAAACGGASSGVVGNHPAAPEISAAQLIGLAPAARPVFVAHQTAYLWLHLVAMSDDPLAPSATLPDCPDVNDRACWKAVPAEADRAAQLGALPPTVTVVTPRGTCVATVGAAKLVNTSGCDQSLTYGAELSGCGTDVAPVGFVGGDVPSDLRWLPTPPIKTAALPADPATLTDPVQRRYVTSWLGTGSLAGTRRDGHTAVVAVDAGAEALTTIVAGALVGDSADECELNAAEDEVLGLRRGDQFTELALTAGPEVDGYVEHVTTWDGALARGGRVVGVVSGGPRQVMLHAIGAGAAPTPLFTETIWWDNEECTQGTWSGVEFPCGP